MRRGWAAAPGRRASPRGCASPSIIRSIAMKHRHLLFSGLCALALLAPANGYFSTMTSVRGTEPDRAYMVAFMDYTKDDISRPAAIPGWSEIDYNPGPGWMNSTRLDPKIFSGYSQILNMHDGTLTTRYRFDYANKATDVKVETFVSQADHHLAGTRISITPQFDDKVQLQFPFRLWSGHQPRFPIASMTGDQMIDAAIASGPK